MNTCPSVTPLCITCFLLFLINPLFLNLFFFSPTLFEAQCLCLCFTLVFFPNPLTSAWELQLIWLQLVSLCCLLLKGNWSVMARTRNQWWVHLKTLTGDLSALNTSLDRLVMSLPVLIFRSVSFPNIYKQYPSTESGSFKYSGPDAFFFQKNHHLHERNL